ncbi:MAG: hypothetical protein HY701_01740 [Gemmatimonadetes bacterium]|nr:hypothetical protein [Gemmatimonadota bacterium]
MSDAIPLTPSSDPLRRSVPLDCVTVIPVLGIPVRFESNAARIVEAAEDAFGSWRVLSRQKDHISAEGVRVVIIVQPGDEGEGPHAPFQYRMPDGQRVLIHTPGSVACSDPLRREAVAYVTSALVADREHFRYSMLEALTLALLSQLDRQPLHAAGLVRGSTALLVWGASGSGKSTLCYAALRAGLAVLADDVVYLQLEPRLRVWGMPGFLHLPPSAAAHFPELAGCTPSLLANGKEKLAVRAAEADAVAPLPVVEHTGICLLERSGAEPALESVAPAEIVRIIASAPESGFDVFADTIGPGLRQLAERGGWRLRVGDSPMGAVALLHTMFDQLDRSAGS